MNSATARLKSYRIPFSDFFISLFDTYSDREYRVIVVADDFLRGPGHDHVRQRLVSLDPFVLVAGGQRDEQRFEILARLDKICRLKLSDKEYSEQSETF